MLNKIRKMLKRINDSYEFKPLLSEIEESPSSPLGHFTFWTIIALIFVIVAWLIVGKIDIVITARGIVIPDGEAKIIQPLETGIIKNILVKEGDFVKQGQLLILIDTMATDAKLESIKKNLKQSKTEAERLEAGGVGKTFKSDDIMQNYLYNESVVAINSSIEAKKQAIVQINKQIDSSQAQKRDYQSQLISAKDRLNRLLNVSDIVAYNNIQDAKDKVKTLEESLIQSEAEIKKFEAQKREINSEIAKLNSEFKAQNLLQLSETKKRIKELEANKNEIEFSNINQKITSPVDGFVDKLYIHTLGGVVTPAQELIALTPYDMPVLIKATVLNKDIGFIRPDMPVSLKIDTFDFQKYGILKGKVKLVSKNSIEDEKLGPVYEAYITPEDTTLMVEGKEQKITTGMSLNAEIEIGRRRIIEFFIYPLIKYMDEGISVR